MLPDINHSPSQEKVKIEKKESTMNPEKKAKMQKKIIQLKERNGTNALAEDIATKVSRKSMEEIEIKKIGEPKKVIENSN